MTGSTPSGSATWPDTQPSRDTLYIKADLDGWDAWKAEAANVTAWLAMNVRRCTGCGGVLPDVIAVGPRAGEPDTFPRCSDCAF